MYHTCPVCHETYYTKHPTQKYCSKECYLKSSRMVGVVTPRRESDLGVREVKPSRRCHDCGRPTTDYRCEKCWARIRSKEENW